jgi:hypothetical protein
MCAAMATDFTRSIAQLSALRAAILTVAERHVAVEMNDILNGALVYAPIDTGLLRSTGKVDGPRGRPVIEAAVQFGSPEAYYAAVVHNRFDLHHEPPTQAGYLQQAVDDATPQMPQRMHTALNAAARSAI